MLLPPIQHRPQPQRNVKQPNQTKNLPTEKAPGPDDFSGEVHQAFKKEIIPTLFRLFQKDWKGRDIFSFFFEASVTLMPKSHKDAPKRGNLL